MVRPLRSTLDVRTHQGFLLSEDEALKAHLSDIEVPGREIGDPGVEVGVWFRWPQGERQIKYPFITIDMLGAAPAFELFTSNYRIPEPEMYRPSVSAEIPAPPMGWGLQSYAMQNFLPFKITYQVSVHSRYSMHDRYLHSLFLTDALPPRPFWIHNPTDDTWRRTELIQSVSAPTSESSESGTKRIFRRIYTLTMLAEVPQDRLADAAVYKALRVFIPIVDREWFDHYHNTIVHNRLTPLDTFTQAQREAAGEFEVIVHEGEEVLAPPA